MWPFKKSRDAMSLDKYLVRRESVALDEVSVGYRTVTLLGADEIGDAQTGYGGRRVVTRLAGDRPGRRARRPDLH